MPHVLVAVTRNTDGPTEKENHYKRALKGCGAETTFINALSAVDEIEGDGLMIMGGPDLPPEMYGQENRGCEDLIPYENLHALDNVFSKIFSERKPILGICMGMQYLNVKCGGTLVQDMGGNAHREGEKGGDKQTEINIYPGSRLFFLLKKNTIHSMCHHHQCIDEPGVNLAVVAKANDRTIEAVEHEEYPFLIGVQWHPERTPDAENLSEDSLNLFRAFVNACATRR
jgi:putative glutamine amidotransferase